MTKEQTERFVENTFFKGGARAAMWLVGIFVVPLVILIITWGHDFALSIDKRFSELNSAIEAQAREFSAQTAKLDAHIQLLELAMANDRKATSDRDAQLNSRIDIVSGRVTDTQHDYARVSDVLSGFERRDDQIKALDHRVGVLEDRIYARSPKDR